MNTIKAGENLTINLPQMKNNQVITVHNFANSETYIFKSEIQEIKQEKPKIDIFNVWKDKKPDLPVDRHSNLTIIYIDGE